MRSADWFVQGCCRLQTVRSAPGSRAGIARRWTGPWQTRNLRASPISRWKRGLRAKNKGIGIERRELADGTVREYHYERKRRAPKREQTVAAVIAAWQDSPEWARLNVSTAAIYVRASQPLFCALRNIAIRKTQRRHLLMIRDTIAKERGHGAASLFCRTVSAFFSWALDRNFIDVSPATRLQRTLRRGLLPTRTEEQARRAMQELPEPTRRAVVLAYYTAQRRGDLCALRWSDY